MAAILGLGLAAAIIGALAGLDAYPWSNAAVLAVGIAGGVLLGRLVPPRARLMFAALAILAALDAAQLLLAGGAGTDSTEIWFSLLVRGDEGALLQIGVADLVVVVAMTVHGARRGLSFWPSIIAAPLGLLVAFGYSQLTKPPEGLVLLPFLLLGWVAVEAGMRAWARVRS